MAWRNSPNARERTQTVGKKDVDIVGDEDRRAVMEMYKDGEISLDDVVARVQAMADARLGRANDGKMKRQGAIKKTRGRLEIGLQIQKASAFSVIFLTVKRGRELISVTSRGSSNPVIRAEILNKEGERLKEFKVHFSKVHKNTTNPMINETFSWELRMKDQPSLSGLMLHICVESQQQSLMKKFAKKTVMGAMAFRIQELWESEEVIDGWYKILDENKGQYQNQPFRPKRVHAGPLSPTPKSPGVVTSPASSQMAPKPTSRPKEPVPITRPSQVKAMSKPKAAKSAPPPMKVDIKNFNFLKVLGQGSFGKVMMSEHKTNKEIYAIKIIRKESVLEEDDVESTMTERRVLALGTGSRFLTRLHATFQSDDKLFYVMEMVTGGDLMFHIQNDKVFSMDRARFYGAQISLGLWFLHEHGVLYRDLKLDNVMLDGEGNVKIADFGMCKEKVFGLTRTTTFCGTPGYLAPEIVAEKPYGFSVDWWSLGVLMYEMTVGDSPFATDDDDQLFDMIQHHNPPFEKGFDPRAKAYIQGLMTRDVDNRLACGTNGKSDVQNHPFYKKIDWGMLEKGQVEPPFKPVKAKKGEATNFDDDFTSEDPTVSPPNPTVVAKIIDDGNQNAFKNFSFINNKFGSFGNQEEEADEEEEPQNLLEGKEWYRPDLSRTQVTQALHRKPLGAFLIRESTTQPGCYALAMQAGGPQPWNGLITPSTSPTTGRLQYQMFAGRKFDTLMKLIEHYSVTPVTKSVSGEPVPLRV
eukprot:m.188616 g.188616  ORF g.188616 m.188616 type:complete len:751 (-) comp32350_c0_seq4:1105-3357(-)